MGRLWLVRDRGRGNNSESYLRARVCGPEYVEQTEQSEARRGNLGKQYPSATQTSLHTARSAITGAQVVFQPVPNIA
jgi:hypothetical protein